MKEFIPIRPLAQHAWFKVGVAEQSHTGLKSTRRKRQIRIVIGSFSFLSELPREREDRHTREGTEDVNHMTNPLTGGHL